MDGSLRDIYAEEDGLGGDVEYIYIYVYIGDWRRGKLIKRGGKINGGENSGSTTLILRGKVGRTVGLFQRCGQKEIVSAPFLTVRS